MSDYTNEAQQRILRLVQTLAGHEMHGLKPGEIAKAQGCSAPMVTRDLANLVEAGLAEQVPATQGWRLGPALVQIALKYSTGISSQRTRLEETENRFTRS